MKKLQLNKALLRATFENPPFGNAETSALLLKVPGALSSDACPAALKVALNEIICNYAFDRYQQHQASDAAVEKSAMQIVQACGAILSVAGFENDQVDPEKLESGLGEGHYLQPLH